MIQKPDLESFPSDIYLCLGLTDMITVIHGKTLRYFMRMLNSLRLPQRARVSHDLHNEQTNE